MKVQNNISALNTWRQLEYNNGDLAKSIRKLSSGNRINGAADDAAGLAIAEKLRMQNTGLKSAQKNCMDGMSLLQTAEGVLGSMTSVVQRMSELCLQAANGIYDSSDREKLGAEIKQLQSNLDETAITSDFNSFPVLTPSLRNDDGILTGGAIDVVFVIDTTGSMSSMIANVTRNLERYVAKLQSEGLDVRLGLVDYRDLGEAHTVKKHDFTDDVSEFKALLGGLAVNGGGDGPEAGLEAIMDPDNGAFSMDFREGVKKHFVMVTDAEVHYDGDSADKGGKDYIYTMEETIDKLKAEDVYMSVIGSAGSAGTGPGKPQRLAAETGGSFLSIKDVNFSDKMEEVAGDVSGTVDGVKKKDFHDLILQVGAYASDAMTVRMYDMGLRSLGLESLSVATQEDAIKSVGKLKDAINKLSEVRGSYGSYYNRLERAYAVNAVSEENTTAAESRIRDADMPKEVVNQVKASILSQSAQAMLAQANLQPKGILQLLS